MISHPQAKQSMQVPMPENLSENLSDEFPLAAETQSIATSLTDAGAQKTGMSPAIKIMLAIVLGIAGTGVLAIGGLFALGWALTAYMGPDICSPPPAQEKTAPAPNPAN
jgi:sugar (pentulose or hexulose) kinase